MKEQTRHFGKELAREINLDEIDAVSGGQVILHPGQCTGTDTGTDNGLACDSDSDYACNGGS